MNREELTHYSQCLDREMHIMVYGQAGIPFLSFPTQDSMCHNYEDFGMILTKDNVHEAMNQRRASFEKYKEEFETTGEITYYGLSDDSYIPWAPQWTTPGIEAYQQS